MGLKGYFIQYKFIIPDNLKHSSYTYQKLFRALYGYTQAVFKSSGKTYHYHREGVLSAVPYIRPGKNCVIIPPGVFQKLIEFFKTGKNPAHAWRGKGEWKAVYYMNEKDIDETTALKSIEGMLERKYVLTNAKEHEKLINELNIAAEKGKSGLDPGYLSLLLAEAQPIVSNDWFKQVYNQSGKLKEFYSSYKKLKGV
ncbi:MAG: hypothetical protein JW744_01550 [Candidatus Diapherotrites archaeon]|uniref:Uncharacterized protein n=1 Tax=Candidatus Iainarchaeum sp. TaxID=3101447 RepID=A0A938YW03_9ARCH|nr:hypothetical protein [Candidatus Diapherotrites archaeon]